MHLENIPLQWVILKGFERDPFPHLAHGSRVMGDSLETVWLIDLYCSRFLVNHGSSCNNVFTYVIGQNVTKPQFSCPRTVVLALGEGSEGAMNLQFMVFRFTENRPFLKSFHQGSKLIMFKFPLPTGSLSFWPLLS